MVLKKKTSSPLAQICMVCLLRILKLYKISQISFAEYHSKRNFVERVHEVNHVLPKDRPFGSQKVQRPLTGPMSTGKNIAC